MTGLAEALRPPTDDEVERALARFADDARRHFGERLIDLVVFGSRARGDHRPDSDVDVAVILEGGDRPSLSDRNLLSDLTYDRIVDDGVEIQAWPLCETAWREPAVHSNPSLVRAIQRDGRTLRSER